MTTPNKSKSKLVPTHDPADVYDVTFEEGGTEQLMAGSTHKVGDKLISLDDKSDPRKWKITAIDHMAKTVTAQRYVPNPNA